MSIAEFVGDMKEFGLFGRGPLRLKYGGSWSVATTYAKIVMRIAQEWDEPDSVSSNSAPDDSATVVENTVPISKKELIWLPKFLLR